MDENHKNVDSYIGINQGALEEALNIFAKIKCQELLLLVAENVYAQVEYDCAVVDKDSIFNAVDLDSFCS